MTRPSLAAHRHAKILIVEDEPRFREFLARTLTDWGLAPDAARMRFNRLLPKLANHIRMLGEGRLDELLASDGA